ncbi:MAG: cell division protein SepF [Acidimicrobiales bacterium]|nr:cell division protein SepF [Acidimicrobiales bacterium]HRW36603.1 cell division protein SepF [Aquihabitans sp.]
MWRKAMVYLGLGDDAEYDEYGRDDGYEPERAPVRERPAPRQSPPPSSYAEEPSAIGAVRPINPRGAADPREASELGQTVTPAAPGGGAVARPRPQVVRPVAVTPNAKPFVVMPTSFNQAQDVADRFKGSQPVIMNLQGADRDLSRRLIDFASGLCYGLGGQMERVANQVYLLTPTNVEVSAEERRRLHERGYDT